MRRWHNGSGYNEGSWEAGVNGAEPGVIMPGTILLGAKYFQERAPEDEAVDRGEIVRMGLTVEIDEFEQPFGITALRSSTPTLRRASAAGGREIQKYTAPMSGWSWMRTLNWFAKVLTAMMTMDDGGDDDDGYEK